jgi:RNA polymerase sigma-70 factor, ECF subfamily
MRVLPVNAIDQNGVGMSEAIGGGLENFDAFYRRESARSVALARALAPDLPHAEDLAQEAFLAAHRNWARVSGYESPQAWVRRVPINKATSLHRRIASELLAVNRIKPTVVSEASPDLSPENHELWDAVRRLPRRQAQAIALHYVGEMTVAEAALVMKCTRGAVKTHLHRGRARLEETLIAWREQT